MTYPSAYCIHKWDDTRGDLAERIGFPAPVIPPGTPAYAVASIAFTCAEESEYGLWDEGSASFVETDDCVFALADTAVQIVTNPAHLRHDARARFQVVELCPEHGMDLDDTCAQCWGTGTNPASDLLGTVRRNPSGTMLAVLWPSPPHPHRWMVTDQWGSCGYESNESVASWPVVGAVPYSPAAGMSLTPTTPAAKASTADPSTA